MLPLKNEWIYLWFYVNKNVIRTDSLERFCYIYKAFFIFMAVNPTIKEQKCIIIIMFIFRGASSKTSLKAG